MAYRGFFFSLKRFASMLHEAPSDKNLVLQRRPNSRDAKLQGCHGMQLGGVERSGEEARPSAIISHSLFINSTNVLREVLDLQVWNHKHFHRETGKATTFNPLQSVIYLDWRRFGLAVALLPDLDLDSFTLTPAWRGLKLLARHSLYLIRRKV